MKNVFLILLLLGGFITTALQAQSCQPCLPGCCMASCKTPNGSTASAQLMPATFDILAAYPATNSVGQADMKCTPAEVAACKTSCTTNKTACSTANAPQCQSAASVAFQPSSAPHCQPASSTALKTSTAPQCQPAATKTLQPSIASSQQAPRPMKG